MEIDDKLIKYFQKKLLKWYGLNGRDFHWRKPGLNTYQYIIAEVLLQRTKAETVHKFYVSFINNYPNWKAIVESSVTGLEESLKPVGLYKQKALRLRNLAVEIDKRNEQLPLERNELESIPLMGQYIANAVELLIFNKKTPLLDVNMARVLERFFQPRTLADIRYDPQLQDLSYKVVNLPQAKELNWAILDLSALICRPKPRCEMCPIKNGCNYFLNNTLKAAT